MVIATEVIPPRVVTAIEALSPRVMTTIGLLAVLPALWYALGRPSTWGYVTAVSTIVIVVSLSIAFQSVAEQHSAENHSTN